MAKTTYSPILSVEQLEAYRRHGFLAVTGLIQPNELARARAAIDQAVTERTADWPVFGLDRDRVAVGARIEGPGLPVAWPREPGSLPEPPTRLGAKVGFGFER